MQTEYARQHLRQLALAQSLAQLDARPITVQRLTGLQDADLHRWFYRNSQDTQPGRAPCSTEWYQRANLNQRVDACLVVVLFTRLCRFGYPPEYALLSAYHGYLELGLHRPRISFDRAVDLTAHTAGLWLTDTPRFAVVTCPTCTREILSDHGRVIPLRCPLCTVLVRQALDPRIQAHFPIPALRQMAQPLLGIASACPALCPPLTPEKAPRSR